MPTTASTTAWIQNEPVGTLASVIAMISAERMKSVLMAPLHLLVLEALRVCVGGADGGLVLVRPMGPQRLEHLLGALVAEIGAADHQQRRDRPGREEAEDQRRRQQVEELVLERPEGDLADDRAVPGWRRSPPRSAASRPHRRSPRRPPSRPPCAACAATSSREAAATLARPAMSSSSAIRPMLMGLLSKSKP